MGDSADRTLAWLAFIRVVHYVAGQFGITPKKAFEKVAVKSKNPARKGGLLPYSTFKNKRSAVSDVDLARFESIGMRITAGVELSNEEKLFSEVCDDFLGSETEKNRLANRLSGVKHLE